MSPQNAPRSSLTSPELITHGPTTGIPRQSYAFGKPPALDYHAWPSEHHINIVDADVRGGAAGVGSNARDGMREIDELLRA